MFPLESWTSEETIRDLVRLVSLGPSGGLLMGFGFRPETRHKEYGLSLSIPYSFRIYVIPYTTRINMIRSSINRGLYSKL